MSFRKIHLENNVVLSRNLHGNFIENQDFIVDVVLV